MYFHRDKPFHVRVARQLVFNLQGDAIGYIKSGRGARVSDRFATEEEAVAEARKLNKSQAIPLYSTNVSGSTVEEVS